MIRFRFTVPIYNAIVRVMICPPHKLGKVASTWVSHATGRPVDVEGSQGCVVDYGKGVWVLWLADAPACIESLSTLAHEVYHLTEEIMCHIGCAPKLGGDNEERAYLAGELTRKVLTGCERARGKR